MSLPLLTFEGRVFADPELRFTPNGKAVVNLTVACNSRRFNRETQEWENGDTYWINKASAWDRSAEAIAATIHKGDIVAGSARLRTRQYEDKEGQKRSAVDHLIESVGVVPRTDSNGARGSGGGAGMFSGNSQTQSNPWGSSADDEPPF